MVGLRLLVDAAGQLADAHGIGIDQGGLVGLRLVPAALQEVELLLPVG